MSAKNWSDCPRCRILAARFDDQIKKIVDERYYGKVSPQQFRLVQRAVEKIENPYSNERQPSLREDYEVFVDKEGRLKFRYLGSCEYCGYDIAGSYETKVDPTPTGTTAEDAADFAVKNMHLVEVDE